MRILTPAVCAAHVLAVCGCGPMQRISDGSFRNATITGAGMELERLGYRVDGRLTCELPKGNTLASVRVDCTGRTVRGQPITVTGTARAANTRDPIQEYVITVAGREVLRKPCLGLGCGKAAAR